MILIDVLVPQEPRSSFPSQLYNVFNLEESKNTDLIVSAKVTTPQGGPISIFPKWKTLSTYLKQLGDPVEDTLKGVCQGENRIHIHFSAPTIDPLNIISYHLENWFHNQFFNSKPRGYKGYK